ncbi:MAG: PIN domain-containing protein [Deferribacteres bacterium]|nr:PIN domain-containing protein [candidate division KSB1 bacterium]MCB9504296.1 PIN domain-containing protein [Deferribacteres bacterium]
MNDKIFLDTNILVYANDKSNSTKQNIAKQIIFESVRSETGVISTQVLSEFYVTVTRKIQVPLSVESAQTQIRLFKGLEIVAIDFPLIQDAIAISQQHLLSYWDSLILAAAKREKCATLLTEDLNHGQEIESVKVKNPFI